MQLGSIMRPLAHDLASASFAEVVARTATHGAVDLAPLIHDVAKPGIAELSSLAHVTSHAGVGSAAAEAKAGVKAFDLASASFAEVVARTTSRGAVDLSSLAHVTSPTGVGGAVEAQTGVKALDKNWFKDAIIYQIVPKSFKDTTGSGHGDIEGIRQNLDYIQSLGADTVWMTPHYPSPGADGGYDISDFTGVAEQLGTADDMRRLGQEMESRGMHLFTELIMNHTSDAHPWFTDEVAKLKATHAQGGQAALRKLDPNSLDYVWDFSPKGQEPTKWKDTRVIFNDSEASNWTWNDDAQGYFWHRFKTAQPDLNYENPAVLERMLGVAKFHLDNGVHALRLDALPYLREEGPLHDAAIATSGENLPETHDIVKQLHAWLDTNYPGRVTVGESNMEVPETLEYMQGDEVHAGFAFPQMTGLWNSMLLGDKRYMLDAQEATKGLPEGVDWVNFTRNHDELTFEKIDPKLRAQFWKQFSMGDKAHGIPADPRSPINLGLRLRGSDVLGDDPQSIDLMHSMLMAEPGTPVIYYGDEIGMRTHRLLEDRDGVRTPMQWNDTVNGGFSTADPAEVYRQLFKGTTPTSTAADGSLRALLTPQEAAATADAQLGVREINVAAQETDPGSILNHTRATNAARRASPAMTRGDFHPVDTGSDQVLAFRRTLGDENVLVVGNLGHEEATSSINLGEFAGQRLVPYHSFEQVPALDDMPRELTMPGRGFRWYHIEPAETGVAATT